jgi:hypothetical protein
MHAVKLQTCAAVKQVEEREGRGERGSIWRMPHSKSLQPHVPPPFAMHDLVSINCFAYTLPTRSDDSLDDNKHHSSAHVGKRGAH